MTAAFDGYKGLVGPEAKARLIYDLTSFFDFIHQFNIDRGWWHDIHTGAAKERNVGEILMLAVSELSEALEGDRKKLKDDKLPQFPMFTVEIGDAIIRLADIAGSNSGAFMGNTEFARQSAEALVAKIEYNFTRSDHTRAARLAGGKAY